MLIATSAGEGVFLEMFECSRLQVAGNVETNESVTSLERL